MISRLIALLVASFLLLPTASHAACDALEVADGMVRTKTELPAAGDLDEAATACVAQIASELSGRPGLRTVTVTLRVPDAARADGSATKVSELYVTALVKAGLPQARVSSVVASGGEPGKVYITYTQRPSTAEIGSLASANGAVQSGASLDALTDATAGEKLLAEAWIQTGADGNAVIDLADGSRIRVRPNTQLHLGKLHMNEDLQRVVELEVQRGSIDTQVAPGGEGSSFRVRTQYGTAGVRGTTFRVSADDTQTRVETTEGLVALEGSVATVQVAAGQGSSIDSSGVPSKPIALATGPGVIAPTSGDLPSKGLQWEKVPGAQGYVIEVADDAEFVLGVRALETTERSIQAPTRPGKHFWRVAAIDGRGFMGLWSTVHSFDVE